MYIRRISIIVILFFIAFQGTAIRIEGTEPAYAGRTLEFFTWSDPVSKAEKSVFTLKPDSKGFFSTEVRVSENTWCYCDFGIYRGMLILSPGINIRLKFPPLKDKSFEESKNPYFEQVEIWLKTENGPVDELTNLVARFDNRYYQLIDKYFNQLYYRQLRNYSDTLQMQIEKDFSQYKNPEFLLHKQLRMKSLEAGIMRTGREKIAGSLKGIPASFWSQPSFSGFINKLFINTLSTESKSPSGSGIKQWIYKESTPELVKWIRGFTSATPPLSDLILLKMLHDAYYSGEFSKPAILHMVGADYLKNNSQPEIRNAAREVELKLGFLRTGTAAPEICLPDISNKTFCSSTNSRPYLYVLFADLEIPVCQEQVKYLKTMSEKTGSSLLLLIITMPSQKVNTGEFITRNLVPGIVVTDTENKMGKKYRVRSYPSAFLLDQSHKVVLAPAKTPLDGFEFQFAGFK